ncbi:DUF4082 domain-containing protein [Actinosynnema mirum]|uniref:Ig-like domain-containing protein n=2 Tax=Actinosynnema TaxID=40566 RepID=C6WFV6_ACTMD|nr:DUF4082 domain-containing protein [Actinosynnema mirum]ACU37892.1 conserved hypothetical protein [Actinosynnema mirum DSM 43827]
MSLSSAVLRALICALLALSALAAPATAEPTCPCGLWDDHDTPAVLDAAEPSAVELGLAWHADRDGYALGVRFYKGPGNTGPHTGSLWSADGRRLATGTFADESGTGWQTLLFPAPVAVPAGVDHLVSYLSPTGHFSVDPDYFTSPRRADPLTAPGAGAFRTGGGFPDQRSGASNYWVDVLWAAEPGPDLRPPALVGTTPVDGASSSPTSGRVTATFDEPVDPDTATLAVTGPDGPVAGAVTTSADRRATTFVPESPLPGGTRHRAEVVVHDGAGNRRAHTWSFTTAAPRPTGCPCSVWDESAAPAVPASADPAAVELGARVRFDGRAEVLGVRFYKGPGNTGPHTGSLWAGNGVLLATGAFADESASGWQTLRFTSPVIVQAATDYVVSYSAPNGHYAADLGYFRAGEATHGAAHLPGDGDGGPNGLYRYGGGFPTSSAQGANYWVDVLYRNGFNGDTTAPTLLERSPEGDAVDAPLTTTFSEPVDPASAQVRLTDPAGARLRGSVSLSADLRTVTWRPDGALRGATRYTAHVMAADVNGNPLAEPGSWSFTTAAPRCPCSLFSTATAPAPPTSGEDTAHELGVRFTPTAPGKVTGVRFHKGPGNTGTHTGSLWSADGRRLATGTFTGESASGWQSLTFATPVVVVPGEVYVASYTAPNGRWSLDERYFQRALVDTPPLRTPAPADWESDGVGVYLPGAGFPTRSYQGNNYWVDAVYTPSADTTPPVLTSRTPLAGAVEVDPLTTVVASFDEPLDATRSSVTVTGPDGAPVAGRFTARPDGLTLVWTPDAPMGAGHHTVSIRTADVGGNVLPSPVTWAFTVGGR